MPEHISLRGKYVRFRHKLARKKIQNLHTWELKTVIGIKQ